MSDFNHTEHRQRSITQADIDYGIRRAHQLRSDTVMRMLSSANPFAGKHR